MFADMALTDKGISMGYSITGNSWIMVSQDMELSEGEVYVEELPQWLVEKADRDELERSAKSALSLRSKEAEEIISPLQAGVDIDEISEDDRNRWTNWKRYLIALSKTPERQGWPANPDWPVLPDF